MDASARHDIHHCQRCRGAPALFSIYSPGRALRLCVSCKTALCGGARRDAGRLARSVHAA